MRPQRLHRMRKGEMSRWADTTNLSTVLPGRVEHKKSWHSDARFAWKIRTETKTATHMHTRARAHTHTHTHARTHTHTHTHRANLQPPPPSPPPPQVPPHPNPGTNHGHHYTGINGNRPALVYDYHCETVNVLVQRPKSGRHRGKFLSTLKTHLSHDINVY